MTYPSILLLKCCLPFASLHSAAPGEPRAAMRVCRWEQRGVSLPALFFLSDCLPSSHRAPLGDVSGLGHSRWWGYLLLHFVLYWGQKATMLYRVAIWHWIHSSALEDGSEMRSGRNSVCWGGSRKGSALHLLMYLLLQHFYEKIYPETTFHFVQKGSWDQGCVLQTNSSRYSRCLHPLLSMGWINLQLL